MLISDEYRDLNRELHERTSYGAFGGKWARVVQTLVSDLRLNGVLDYGCGKGTLKKALDLVCDADVREYDPAIEGKNGRPLPADLVVCTDVLEHIEPELLSNVVADLKNLARRYLFVVVSTRPAKKTLADGRNAHLIVRPFEDWAPDLTRDWMVVDKSISEGEFALLMCRKSEAFRVSGVLNRFRWRRRGAGRLRCMDLSVGP